MSNVDVAALAGELDALLRGSRIEKAYQPDRDQVLLRLRRKGVGRMDLLFQLGRYVTITRRPPENPDKPSMVAQILRNEYGNGRVTRVAQVGFDRLLRIDVQKGDGDRALVLELFGDGNLLLLDADGTIRLPMRGVEHGARRLKKGEVYQPPPGGAHPFDLEPAAFREAGRAAKKDVVRFVALDLGFGPQWAEELCARAGVEKNLAVTAASDADWDALHAAVMALGSEIRRNDLAPALVHADGELVDAVPFVMQTLPAPRFQSEEAPSFREALDVMFRGAADDEDVDDPRRARFEAAKGKVERQVAQIEEAIGGFEADEAEARADGDTLYAQFQAVDEALRTIQEARKTRDWKEIEGILARGRAEGNPMAKRILALHAHDATAVLRLEDLDGTSRDITVDVRKTVQENAQDAYAAAKKARSRREGAGTALAETRKRLADVEAKGLDGFGAAPKRVQGPSRHFWFETYRWTLTPGGFLCVGGRSAAQNDQVVKKYLRDGDRYVHAEIHGAPSVVVRPLDGSVAEPGEDDLLVAGRFAVCASRAWRQFGQASAYWVTAQQVSKTPRSGEFVPKGAWIIHGKRNVLDRLPMEWAVGRIRFTKGGLLADADLPESEVVEKILGGPVAAVQALATDVVKVHPGDMEPNEAAVRLAAHMDVDVEAVQGALPNGPVRLEGVPDRADHADADDEEDDL